MENFKDKNELRKALFNKYFEVEEGISVGELVEKIECVRNVYEQLKILVYSGNRKFDIHFFHKSPSGIKKVQINGISYLVVCVDYLQYVVIDLDKKCVMTDYNEVIKIFGKEPFNIISECLLPHFETYTGDIDKLNAFYDENKDYFSFIPQISYDINIGEACTYFHISLNNREAQLGFSTPNQFIYETLFFNGDLKPLGMQDAHHSMGREKMIEILNVAKSIVFPYSAIPEELFRLGIVQRNKEKVKE